MDPEDGPLDGNSLKWESNVDGPLGSGTAIRTTLSGVIEGQHKHTITLQGTDSDDKTATHSIEVIVLDLQQGQVEKLLQTIRESVERRLHLRSLGTLRHYELIVGPRADLHQVPGDTQDEAEELLNERQRAAQDGGRQ